MAGFGDTAFRCSNILLEDVIVDGAIVVDSAGKITRILETPGECENLERIARLVKIEKGVLMPGIVDSHVHINSPGRSEWEDFPFATRAAAAGGITTLADMPLNSIPPTTTLDNLSTKLNVARNNIYVDVTFWGGVLPNNRDELLRMVNAGVFGFKCFLCPSGVEEFPHVNEEDLEKTMEILENSGAVLAFHAECELDEVEEPTGDPNVYSTYLGTRPPEMENEALKVIERVAKKYPEAQYHVVHVSANSAADRIQNMKRDGVNITAESCPHYLTLCAENVPDGATQFKCAPPVRESKNQELLWTAVKEGTIDMIVSDHSPCTPECKEGGFLQAWGGISSLQFGLSVIWTAASKIGVSLSRLSKLMSANPAKLCRVDDKKGILKVGMDADMIVFDPADTFVLNENMILYKNKLSPYIGKTLTGRVLRTYLRGKLIYDGGEFSEEPQGEILLNRRC